MADEHSSTLPREARTVLNERRTCVRCQGDFYEITNIGQLRCKQSFFVYDHEFIVAADHKPVADEAVSKRAATVTEYKSGGWRLYRYEPEDDVFIDARYVNHFPTPNYRALLTDGLLSEERVTAEAEADADELRSHFNAVASNNADADLHPHIRDAMSVQFYDDEDDRYLERTSFDARDDSDDDDAEIETAHFQSFARQLRVRRYDWRAERHFLEQLPHYRRAYENKAENVTWKPEPIWRTSYARYPRDVAQAYGYVMPPFIERQRVQPRWIN